MEDMFARELLPSIHSLSTDETLMSLHQFLCSRIFESLLEAVGQLQIFNERNQSLVKGSKGHPHISTVTESEEKSS
jgi:hypothetical protein